VQVPLAAGVLLGVAFVAIEARQRDPLVGLSLFRERFFLSGSLAAFFSYAALFSLTITMPFFLLDTQRRGLVAAGLLVGIVPVALAGAAPLGGWVSDRVGSRGVCALGMLAVAAGLALGALLTPEAGVARIAPCLALTGLGLGLFEAPNSASALAALPDEELGSANAVLGVMRNLGMTVGAALAATLLDAGGFRPALASGVCVALLAIGAVALRPAGKAEPRFAPCRA
jgi:MFS family permease